MIEPKAAGEGGNSMSRGKNPFLWSEFDALPSLVRRVIAFAPCNLGTGRATQAVMGGASPEIVARREVAVARAAMARATLETYGPEHPEARPCDHA